jgi:hypothetical protein
MARARLREARVEAERMVLATQAALQADGDLLTADERAAIEALMATTRRWPAATMRPPSTVPSRPWPRAPKPLPRSA